MPSRKVAAAQILQTISSLKGRYLLNSNEEDPRKHDVVPWPATYTARRQARNSRWLVWMIKRAGVPDERLEIAKAHGGEPIHESFEYLCGVHSDVAPPNAC